jgi:hypothetical protein
MNTGNNEEAMATSTSNTQLKKVSPLHVYIKKYCQTCIDSEYCNNNHTRRLTCVICALVRNLEKRQELVTRQ